MPVETAQLFQLINKKIGNKIYTLNPYTTSISVQTSKTQSRHILIPSETRGISRETAQYPGFRGHLTEVSY